MTVPSSTATPYTSRSGMRPGVVDDRRDNHHYSSLLGDPIGWARQVSGRDGIRPRDVVVDARRARVNELDTPNGFGGDMPKDSTALRAEERSEADKHDVLYRRPDFQRLLMNETAWKRFDRTEPVLDPYVGSMVRLGSVAGLRVLDAGCGDGWLSIILAKRGAFVEGFDISAEGVRVAQRRADVNGVADQCRFSVASFYEMPLAAESVDAVIGQAILHHLGQKARAANELFRVMKPGARAVFAEPLGNALWFERLRLFVPVVSEAPEDPGEWERQFKYTDIEPFKEKFEVELEEFQLLSRVDRIVSWQPFTRAVGRFDRWLLKHARFLRPYSRAAVIELRRRRA